MTKLSKDQKLALAKAKLREKSGAAEREILYVHGDKAMKNLDNNLSEVVKIIGEFLDEVRLDEATEKQLIDLNNNTVKLIGIIEQGLFVKDMPQPLDEVSIKNLSDINIPEAIKILNPTEVPKDLAKSKDIQTLSKTIEAALAEAVAKASATDAPSQKPSDFVPMRRVIKRGQRFEFDDQPTGMSSGFISSSGGGGGGSGDASAANQLTEIGHLSNIESTENANNSLLDDIKTSITAQENTLNNIENNTSSIKENTNGFLIKVDYDYLERKVVDDTETYTYKSGGSGGTTVATITVVYTDNTLTDIVSVART